MVNVFFTVPLRTKEVNFIDHKNLYAETIPTKQTKYLAENVVFSNVKVYLSVLQLYLHLRLVGTFPQLMQVHLNPLVSPLTPLTPC